MKGKIITTNIRLPATDLTHYRVMASEKGISFNQFVNQALKEAVNRQYFADQKPPAQRLSIRDLPKMAVPFKSDDEVDWNDHDKIIYGEVG